MQERAAAEAAGLRVGLIYERAGNEALGGRNAGIAAATDFIGWTALHGVRPSVKSAVFLTCDFDAQPSEHATILGYWQSFSDAILAHGWQIGGYVQGDLQEQLILQFHDRIYYPWSVGAKGWGGTRQFDLTNKWILNQGPTLPLAGGSWPMHNQLACFGTFMDPQDWPASGLQYDPDIALTLDWAL